MSMKLVVTIEIEVGQTFPTEIVEQAVQNRLFGQGFLPDDVEIDAWGISTHWAPSNPWEENPDHPVADWQQEVGGDYTRRGYWAWVASQVEET